MNAHQRKKDRKRRAKAIANVAANIELLANLGRPIPKTLTRALSEQVAVYNGLAPTEGEAA